jgi:hypothetical protein
MAWGSNTNPTNKNFKVLKWKEIEGIPSLLGPKHNLGSIYDVHKK